MAVGNQHGKLIAANAAGHVLRPLQLAQLVSKHLQHRVAFRMSPEIVNRLELIEAKIEDAESRTGLLKLTESLFTDIIKTAPVTKLRETVSHRHIDDFKFIFNNGGNVLHRRDILCAEIAGFTARQA